MTRGQNETVGTQLAQTALFAFLAAYFARNNYPGFSRVAETIGTSCLASGLTFFAVAQVTPEEAVTIRG